MPPAETWVEALARTELFAGADAALLKRVAAGLEETSLVAGEYLVRQGQDADSLFVVVEGQVEVLVAGAGEAEIAIRRLGPWSVMGEIALVVGGKRSASLRAVEATRVLVLSRASFDELLQTDPQLMDRLSRPVFEGIRRSRGAAFLRELFGNPDEESLQEIERQVTWVHLPAGRELFHQGDTADGAYIVVEGRLRVVVAKDRDERVIDEQGPGQWIGEMALVTGKQRSATVIAVRDTELMWLPEAAFDRLVMSRPRAMREATRVLVERMQRQMRGEAPPQPVLRTVAVVPIDSGQDAAELAQLLAATLARYGATLHLTAERLDHHLGKRGISGLSRDDPAQLRVTPWLMEQEETHQFIVLQADARWSPWTERAVRHADHIVLVADATRAPQPGPGDVERRLAAAFEEMHAPKQSLVLLQPAGRRTFPGTGAFLAGRRLVHHHHVRRGTKADVERVARILTGRGIGLVLGGGGARGYAHLGVLQAFVELGIPIDAIGGTSIGALIGAGAAFGLTWQEMLATYPHDLRRNLMNVTLPLVSLLSGHRSIAALEGVLGSLDIEDLATPFFCVSTNLTRGGEVVHRRGSAVITVRASTSLPGIFPPVPWEGDLLVDGGLANNVPVDTMASFLGGAVVAVDVMPDVELAWSGDVRASLSGWSVAHRRLNPFVKTIAMPDILSILIRSATTASWSVRRAEASAKLAALYLRPPVTKWNMVDFRAAEPVVSEGYRGTIGQIRDWWSRERPRIMGNSSPGG